MGPETVGLIMAWATHNGCPFQCLIIFRRSVSSDIIGRGEMLNGLFVSHTDGGVMSGRIPRTGFVTLGVGELALVGALGAASLVGGQTYDSWAKKHVQNGLDYIQKGAGEFGDQVAGVIHDQVGPNQFSDFLRRKNDDDKKAGNYSQTGSGTISGRAANVTHPLQTNSDPLSHHQPRRTNSI